MRILYEGAYFSISNIKNEDMNVLSLIFFLSEKNAYLHKGAHQNSAYLCERLLYAYWTLRGNAYFIRRSYFSISYIKNEDMNVLSHIFVLLRKKCVLYTKVCNKIVRTYARGYFTAKLVLRNDLKGDDNLLDGRI